MAMTKDRTPPEPGAAAADLRAVLIKRLALAGGLVAVLLSVLAFFDYLSKAGDEPDLPVFTQPVPVGPRKPITQPVTPADNLPAPPQAETSPAEGAVTPEDKESGVTAALEPPAPPTPAAMAAQSSGRAESAAVTPSTAPQRVESPRSTVPRPDLVRRTPAPVPTLPQGVPTRGAPEEMTASPPMRPAPAAAPEPSQVLRAERPSSSVATNSPPGARVLQRTPRLFSGFVLQAGVFNSVQRAEELHAKLTLSGVPSSVETRVQVGPFRTREEAEAAQAKLRELGIDSILVPTRGKP